MKKSIIAIISIIAVISFVSCGPKTPTYQGLLEKAYSDTPSTEIDTLIFGITNGMSKSEVSSIFDELVKSKRINDFQPYSPFSSLFGEQHHYSTKEILNTKAWIQTEYYLNKIESLSLWFDEDELSLDDLYNYYKDILIENGYIERQDIPSNEVESDQQKMLPKSVFGEHRFIKNNVLVRIYSSSYTTLQFIDLTTTKVEAYNYR